jgi:hypothetical protein|tara:strand:+ start:832 stop:1593 length:762 start_codon:yes stop_codon:yes gene_type:complete
MAINVNKVYRTVLSIINKEGRGFLTPDQFNRIGRQVQLDLLDRAFFEYNRAVISHSAGRAVNDYGDIPEKIQEKIDPFYKAADITLTNGVGSLPTDIYKIINISITNKNIQLEKVDKKNLSYLLSSPLTKPTTSFPVYYQRTKSDGAVDSEGAGSNPTLDIIVEPAFTDQSWTLGNLLCEYIKVPADPKWDFSGGTTNSYSWDESGSKNFELHPADEVDLIVKILGYTGIIIKDPTVIQAAGGEESKIIQLKQ